MKFLLPYPSRLSFLGIAKFNFQKTTQISVVPAERKRKIEVKMGAVRRSRELDWRKLTI